MSANQYDIKEAQFRDRIGHILRTVRERSAMTLADIEQMTDGTLKIAVLGSYERGDRMPSVYRLVQLANVYRVPLSELIPSDANEVPLSELVPSDGDKPSPEPDIQSLSHRVARLELSLASVRRQGKNVADEIAAITDEVQQHEIALKHVLKWLRAISNATD